MSDPIYIAEYDGLIREVLASGGEFRLYPHGTSMQPLLRQGLTLWRCEHWTVRPENMTFYFTGAKTAAISSTGSRLSLRMDLSFGAIIKKCRNTV